MEETKVSEAIIALASAVSGKDLTSEGDGTKATALTVLSDALGDPETDADTALYDAAQFATRRSTDTEEAAKSVLALSSGGGAQSYPISASDVEEGYTLKFYNGGEYPPAEITEQEAGKLVLVAVYNESVPYAQDISGGMTISCDYGDFAPNKYQWTSDLHQYTGFIMPDCPVGIMYYKE